MNTLKFFNCFDTIDMRSEEVTLEDCLLIHRCAEGEATLIEMKLLNVRMQLSKAVEEMYREKCAVEKALNS